MLAAQHVEQSPQATHLAFTLLAVTGNGAPAGTDRAAPAAPPRD